MTLTHNRNDRRAFPTDAVRSLTVSLSRGLATAALLLGTAVTTGAQVESWAERAALSSPRSDFSSPPFGSAVAVSGDTLAVGGHITTEGERDAHSVFVYQRDADTGEWLRSDRLYVDTIDQSFGDSLALDGDRLIVGAYADDEIAINAGALYVFDRDPESGGWIETAKLTSPNSDLADYVGQSVAVFGDIVVTGTDNDDELGSNAGAAYIFERDESTGEWSESIRLLEDGGAHSHRFGSGVAVYGTTVVVGASDANAFSGFVYIYDKDPQTGEWAQTQRLDGFGGDPKSGFGGSVAISENTLAIGAEHEMSNTGAAYVYARDPNTGLWLEDAALIGDDTVRGDWFGAEVAISDDLIVVSAPEDEEFGQLSGSAYVFARDPETGSWDRISKLIASNGITLGQFGLALDTDGETIAVGAPPYFGFIDPIGSGYAFSRTMVDPATSISGSCPGEVTIQASGLTPKAWVQAHVAESEGAFSDVFRCADVTLGLENPSGLSWFLTDESGGFERTQFVADAFCDRPVQLLDVASCATSPVAYTP